MGLGSRLGLDLGLGLRVGVRVGVRGSTSYASDMRAIRSPVVLTGAKRERGIRMACAP